MNKRNLSLPLASVLIFAATSASLAAGPGSGGGGGGGGGGTIETAGSNISFPIILTDNVSPAAFPLDGAWRFASITAPETECVGEAGVTPGTAVSSTIPCYFGRHVTVNSETGAISFDGPAKVWWLQKRPVNFWKAFTVGHNSTDTKMAVSAVDVGDLLESSPSIATRQIRTEFNLLQNVAATDPDFGAFVVTDFTTLIPAPCKIPTAAGESVGCFAALAMSGPVPGTQQTINEAQGTDFGPGPTAGQNTGTLTLVDPTRIRTATTPDGTAIPIHAIDYSRCARLSIQKIEGSPIWDKTTGQWSGSGVGTPVVNVAAYTDTYSAEINSGGGLVYGFNWNAKTASTGTYRLTFVLDGNDAEGPRCSTPLLTKFDSTVTKLVNVGEKNAPHIIFAGDSQLGDEGGLVYIDLTLSPKGGGGGAKGRRP